MKATVLLVRISSVSIAMLVLVTLLALSVSAQTANNRNVATQARAMLGGMNGLRHLPPRNFAQSLTAKPHSQTPATSSNISVTYGPVDYPRIVGSGVGGINKKGQMAGGLNIIASSGCTAGYLLTGNNFRKFIYPPGALESCVLAINDSGEMLGDYSTDGQTLHAFSLVGNVFTNIPDYPGSVDRLASGVDNFGNIVGLYTDVPGVSHGFVYSNGTFTSIDVPGATDTFLNATSPDGAILAGSYYGSDGHDHGFVLHSGVFITVDYPGAVDTEILGVNDSGDYVGNWGNGTLVQDYLEYNGFFFKGGTYTPLTLPWAGVSVTWPTGLNDTNQIAGADVDSNGIVFGFYAAAK
jgi:hypothetical protein